ncbi:BtaA family protein [Aliifodinibius sp. S!AR15-10]|uniref:DUF3419 family protein n=1 Tax=Aliifodinibius sp. S!AR15-10 TaxID=2950437 RepID=UPI00285F9138|nr:DUF3419 family protein [Aliifodinibius sp. S!AR15-10]MDR8394399.1 BtaA family protein [Aliifodinibius sp. S!AR15-10]
MLKRTYLYDFGVSQDDPRSEVRALKPVLGDRILCIASAGEVPLELLVNSHESITIDAVDIAESQLFLSNLKLKASVSLQTEDAARFLGYLPSDRSNRMAWFEQIMDTLPDQEMSFWLDNPQAFEHGPIHLGRYETYIARFAPLGRWLLGGYRKILGLFETKGIEAQKEYFDHELRTGLLKNLFKLMFHRRLYRRGGIPEQGLIHMGQQNIGLRFYAKFRDFCTNTSVRENWMLQFVLFNRVLFEEALPSYLRPAGRERLQTEQERLQFIKVPYTDILETADRGHYNKFALSNVSDWLTEDDFMALMDIISQRAGDNARGLTRYIHSSGIVPSRLPDNIQLDYAWGKQLQDEDRFPFYSLIPFKVKNDGDRTAE